MEITGPLSEERRSRERNRKLARKRRSRSSQQARSALRSLLLDSDNSDEPQGFKLGEAGTGHPPSSLTPVQGGHATSHAPIRPEPEVPDPFLATGANVAGVPATLRAIKPTSMRISNVSFVEESPAVSPLTEGVPSTPTEELGALAIEAALGRAPFQSNALELQNPQLLRVPPDTNWPPQHKVPTRADHYQPPPHIFPAPETHSASAILPPHHHRLQPQPPLLHQDAEESWRQSAPYGVAGDDYQRPPPPPDIQEHPPPPSPQQQALRDAAAAGTSTNHSARAAPIEALRALPAGPVQGHGMAAPANGSITIQAQPRAPKSPIKAELGLPGPLRQSHARLTALQRPSSYGSPAPAAGRTMGFASLTLTKSPTKAMAMAALAADGLAALGPGQARVPGPRSPTHAALRGAAPRSPLAQRLPGQQVASRHYPGLSLQPAKPSPQRPRSTEDTTGPQAGPQALREAPGRAGDGATAGGGGGDGGGGGAAAAAAAAGGSDAAASTPSRARLNLAGKLHSYTGLGLMGASPMAGRLTPRVTAVALPSLSLVPGGRGPGGSAVIVPCAGSSTPGGATARQGAVQVAASGRSAAAPAEERHAEREADHTPAGQQVRGCMTVGAAAAAAVGGGPAPPSSARSTPFDEDMLAALDSLERRVNDIPAIEARAAALEERRPEASVAWGAFVVANGAHHGAHKGAPPLGESGGVPVVSAWELLRQQEAKGRSADQHAPPHQPGGQGLPAPLPPPQQLPPPGAPPHHPQPQPGPRIDSHAAAQPPQLMDADGRHGPSDEAGRTPEVSVRGVTQPAVAVVAGKGAPLQPPGAVAGTGVTPELESGSVLAALDELEERHRRAEAEVGVGVAGPTAAEAPGGLAGAVSRLAKDSPLPVKQLAFTPVHGGQHHQQQPQPYRQVSHPPAQSHNGQLSYNTEHQQQQQQQQQQLPGVMVAVTNAQGVPTSSGPWGAGQAGAPTPGLPPRAPVQTAQRPLQHAPPHPHPECALQQGCLRQGPGEAGDVGRGLPEHHDPLGGFAHSRQQPPGLDSRQVVNGEQLGSRAASSEAAAAAGSHAGVPAGRGGGADIRPPAHTGPLMERSTSEAAAAAAGVTLPGATAVAFVSANPVGGVAAPSGGAPLVVPPPQTGPPVLDDSSGDEVEDQAEAYAAPLTQRALAEGHARQAARRASLGPGRAARGSQVAVLGNLEAAMGAAAAGGCMGRAGGGEGEENQNVDREVEAGPNGDAVMCEEADGGGGDGVKEMAAPAPPRQLEAYLPEPLCNAYYERGGRFELYEWQAECLCQLGVLMGRNLVYCAPTSGGKSMVAEVLGIRRLLTTGKPFMLVLPFVALCAEKAEALQALLAPINRVVNPAYGGQQSGKIIQPGVGAIVATIEKANSLVNAMLEEETLGELSAVIVDELHMVGEEERGYLLELLLTKLRFATSASSGGGAEGEEAAFDWTAVGPAYQRDGLQVIGMSATMPNVDVVAHWLDAALYTTSFRPVQLQEYVKVGRRILNARGELVRELDGAGEERDGDHVAALTAETVKEGHSVLIFCASKLWCEKVAEFIARTLQITQRERPPVSAAAGGGGEAGGGGGGVGDGASPQRNARDVFVAELRRLSGSDPTLPDLVARGVAYHHAGLSAEERDLVEAAYKAGAISVLTATSTLAAGVNLPARRVIFRHTYIGRADNPIDATKYRQMSGRAGRAGIDSAGESFLLCERNKPVGPLLALMQQTANPIQSCLTESRKGMKRAVLEVVASGAVSSGTDVKRFVGCTLLQAQNGFPAVAKATVAALHWLKDNCFIRVDEGTLNWNPTPFGKATLASSMPPEEALVVRGDLERARQSLVLATDLHVTYLVTPIKEDLRVDWEIYFHWFEKLSKVDARVAELVGVVPGYLVRLRQGHRGARGGASGAVADAEKERIARRFFAAMVINDLIQEVPLKEVAEKYGLGKEKGPLEGLQERAGRFAAMVAAFCERLGWADLEVIIAKFQSRVWYGVRPEVVALTEIPYVKGHRARLLFKAGLRTPEAVAGCELERLIEILSAGAPRNPEHEEQQRRTERRAARMILQGAKDLVNHKVQELKEQAKALRAAMDPSITQQHSAPLHPSLAPPQPPPQRQSSSSAPLLAGSAPAELLPDLPPDAAGGTTGASAMAVAPTAAAPGVAGAPVDAAVARLPGGAGAAMTSGDRAHAALASGHSRDDARASTPVRPQKQQRVDSGVAATAAATVTQATAMQRPGEAPAPQGAPSGAPPPAAPALAPVIDGTLQRGMAAAAQPLPAQAGMAHNMRQQQLHQSAAQPPPQGPPPDSPRRGHQPAMDPRGHGCTSGLTAVDAAGLVGPAACKRPGPGVEVVGEPDEVRDGKRPRLTSGGSSAAAVGGGQYTNAPLPQHQYDQPQPQPHPQPRQQSKAQRLQPQVAGGGHPDGHHPQELQMQSHAATRPAGQQPHHHQIHHHHPSHQQQAPQQHFQQYPQQQQQQQQQQYHHHQHQQACQNHQLQQKPQQQQQHRQQEQQQQQYQWHQNQAGQHYPAQLQQHMHQQYQQHQPRHQQQPQWHQQQQQQTGIASGPRTAPDGRDPAPPQPHTAPRSPQPHAAWPSPHRHHRHHPPSPMPKLTATNSLAAPPQGHPGPGPPGPDRPQPAPAGPQPHHLHAHPHPRSPGPPTTDPTTLPDYSDHSCPLLHVPGFTVLKTAAEVAAVCEQLKQVRLWGFALDFADSAAAAAPAAMNPRLQLPNVPQVALGRGVLLNSIGLPLHFDLEAEGDGAALPQAPSPQQTEMGSPGRLEGIALCAFDGCALYVPLVGASWGTDSGGGMAGVPAALTPAALAAPPGGGGVRAEQEAAVVLAEVRQLLSQPGSTKVTFDLKQQLLAARAAAGIVLGQPGPLDSISAAAAHVPGGLGAGAFAAALAPLEVADPVVDARILLWMLNPDDHVNLPRGKSGKMTPTRGLEDRMKHPDVCGTSAHAKALGVLGCAGSMTRQLPTRQADACRRAAMVRRIYQDKLPRMQSEGLLQPLVRLEMPLVRVLVAMEAAGVALAPHILREQRAPLEARLRQLAHKAHVAAGMTFDLNSPKDVSEVLFQHLGLPPPPCAFTSQHQKHPSTKKEVLEELEESTRHPILRTLLDYRSLHKLLTGFVEALYSTAREQWLRQQQANQQHHQHQQRQQRGPRDQVVPEVVRLCGTWLHTATATGRLAMDDPNLQTIPRPVQYTFQLSQESGEVLPMEEGAGGDGGGRTTTMHFNLRTAFVAPPGHVILTADYKQIELRLMAHFSGDTALCQLLRSPDQDPFTLLAAEWKRLPREQVTPELRVQAKRLAYGMLYGMGTSTLAAELGVSVLEAAQLSDNFRKAIPGVDRWTREVVEECRSCGYVVTLLGRRRYFPRINERSSKEARSQRAQAERQAVNSVCQGSAADLVKAAMITLQRQMAAGGLADKARMVLMVHDELVFEVEASALPRVAALVQQVLEGEVALAVPLPVKLSVGPTWGQLAEYEFPEL